jgi:TPR repeat protein
MSKLVGMIVAIPLLSSTLEVRTSSVEDAATAHTRGDDATAFKILQPLAAQGDADARYSLGATYFKREGSHKTMQNPQVVSHVHRAGRRTRTKQSRHDV